jgi:predicted nucleic acid-binding protein
MSIVVSDTSPIRAIHFLKQTDILKVLFATVIIPPPVANELAHPHRTFDPLDPSALKFIEVRAPDDQQRVEQYAAALDLGEAEA